MGAYYVQYITMYVSAVHIHMFPMLCIWLIYTLHPFDLPKQNPISYIFVVVARDNGTLRLVGGSNYRRGRVEIFIEPNNTWGIVCDDNWDDIDARVVCRQLGFGNTGTHVLTYPSPAPNGIPIWLDDVACTGHESRLIDCPHDGLENHNCIDTEDAGVICTGDFPSLYNTMIILSCEA